MAHPTPTLIGYVRVSTAGQGRSGLGLEAQRAAVQAYAARGGSAVARWYTEVESGRKADRPELARALADARRAGAVVVVAKLDRMARNARVLLGIVESGADVVFCDFPTIPAGPTGKFILTQMAAVAELEAGMISERTRAALAAYKARGGVLGAARPECRRLTPELSAKGRAESARVQRDAAGAAYADLLPALAAMRAEGRSLRQIAEALNADGHTTRRGMPWNAVQVGRVLSRAGSHRHLPEP